MTTWRLSCDAATWLIFIAPILVRRIDVLNRVDAPRQIHLFHHQDFDLFGTKVGDTAYFDPQLECLIHYRQKRYLMATWYDSDGQQRIDQYATGLARFHGAEGTWRDAEDGELGTNPIAQGAVDSTMMIMISAPPLGRKSVYLVIGAGESHEQIVALHQFLATHGPQGVIDRTRAYWKLWLSATRDHFSATSSGGPPAQVVDLFRRSLLVLRTQIDNGGAIIAANDSDVMQFSRDTYSYVWPRDGAMVAAALDSAGYPELACAFYAFCSKILTDQGYFHHKYNPDSTPASSWHPWVSDGRTQLPIQEDATALVAWALWRHYQRYRDLETIRRLWVELVMPVADCLLRFRDPATQLPLPSYDLWEERFGVHAFTVAAVYGGLEAAQRFAHCFGDQRRTRQYGLAAQQMREAFCRHFWSPPHERFLRRIVPQDHDRTSRLLGQVINGEPPQASEGPVETAAPLFEHDHVLDSSMSAIFSMGLLSVHDERVERTMTAIERRLWVIPRSAAWLATRAISTIAPATIRRTSQETLG